jgi:hypothetical protein
MQTALLNRMMYTHVACKHDARVRRHNTNVQTQSPLDSDTSHATFILALFSPHSCKVSSQLLTNDIESMYHERLRYPSKGAPIGSGSTEVTSVAVSMVGVPFFLHFVCAWFRNSVARVLTSFYSDGRGVLGLVTVCSSCHPTSLPVMLEFHTSFAFYILCYLEQTLSSSLPPYKERHATCLYGYNDKRNHKCYANVY